MDTPMMIEAKRPDGTVLYREAMQPCLLADVWAIIMRKREGPPGGMGKIIGPYQMLMAIPDGL